jgi:hypothetical protein
MNLTVETPALLFPAIALLLLAYTNRYHFIVTLIRELITRCESEGLCDISIIDQYKLLKKKNTSYQAHATTFGYEFASLHILYRYNCI